MTPVPSPYRVYDTRPAFQADVREDFREANAALAKKPFVPGETREIVVGMVSEVYVVVTAVGHGNGFFSVNDPAGSTSIIGYDVNDRVETNGAPVLAPGGKITLTCNVGSADAAVDVYATKP